MGRFKHRLSFYAISTSAYISPLLMILSLVTSHWLYSTEKLSFQMLMKATLSTTPPGPTNSMMMMRKTPIFNSNSNNGTTSGSGASGVITATTTTVRPKHGDPKTTSGPHIKPLEYIEATYGLWEMCTVKDTSRRKLCEYVKHFQGSDSEATVTDTLKKQIGSCLVPILLALAIMITSCILHTYAFFRKKSHYLFLLSGCLFIFAGLASLTGLIVFIAAVNGAVDNKLTMNKSKEEAPFDYNYGISFFFAVLSFLTQELNGICNIYWYVDYYRKYKYDSSEKAMRSHTSSMFQIPTIKVNDVITDDSAAVSAAPIGSQLTVLPPPPPPPPPPLSAQPPPLGSAAATNARKQSSGSSSGAVSIGFFAKRTTSSSNPPAANPTERQPKQFDLKATQMVGKSYPTSSTAAAVADENSSLFDRSGAEDDLSRTTSSIDSSKRRRPTVNRIHKLNHQLYKLNIRKAKENAANSTTAAAAAAPTTSTSSNPDAKKSTSAHVAVVDHTMPPPHPTLSSALNNKYTVLKMNNNSMTGGQQPPPQSSSLPPPPPPKSVGFCTQPITLASSSDSPPPPNRGDDATTTTTTTTTTSTTESETNTTASHSSSTSSATTSSSSSGSGSSSGGATSASESTCTDGADDSRDGDVTSGSSTQTPSHSPSMSSTTELSSGGLNPMMMPSTSAAAAAGGGRKMVRNENFVRFGKTASTKQQHSLDPDENELKARFYKISEMSPKQHEMMNLKYTATGGPTYHPHHQHYQHYHHHHRHQPPYGNTPPIYPSSSPPSSSSAVASSPPLPPPASGPATATSSSSLHHHHHQQQQQYYISHHPGLMTGATGSALNSKNSKTGQQIMPTQRQRQDWFRRGPKHYAQSYDTSLFNHYYYNNNANKMQHSASSNKRHHRPNHNHYQLDDEYHLRHHPPNYHHHHHLQQQQQQHRHHHHHHQPSENNDENQEEEEEVGRTVAEDMYGEKARLFGLLQPYYPQPPPPPNPNPNQQWPNSNSLAAALNAAEAAAYDYRSKYNSGGGYTTHEYGPPSSWFDRVYVGGGAGEGMGERRPAGCNNKKSLSKSQPQFWWDHHENMPQVTTTTAAATTTTTPLFDSHPFQIRVNSRRDTFVNQIQRAASGGKTTPRGVGGGAPTPTTTTTNTTTSAAATSTSVANSNDASNDASNNSDYRPVTKYIIEDEDAYVISNGGYVPIFGGGLKRTTSV